MDSNQVRLRMNINKTYFIELKRALWEHNVSAQSFFSYIVKLTGTGDERIFTMFEEIKTLTAQNVIEQGVAGDTGPKQEQIVTTDIDSIYHLIDDSIKRDSRKKNQDKGKP